MHRDFDPTSTVLGFLTSMTLGSLFFQALGTAFLALIGAGVGWAFGKFIKPHLDRWHDKNFTNRNR